MARSSRGSGGWRQQALSATAVALLASCVRTDVDAVESGVPCAATASPTAAAEALVWIRVDLGDSGYRFCTAVAISPSLLVTAHSCVAYPSELGEESVTGTSGALSPLSNITFLDPDDHDQFCDTAASAAVEDGSFRARFGDTVPEAAVGVGLMEQPARPAIRVDALLTAQATSRCNDAIAVLLVAGELDVPVVPLRLEPRSSAGEPVLLSAAIGVGGRWLRRDVDTRIDRATFDRGDELTPARSLLLPAATCYSERGGAVFSEATGALVGVVAWTGGLPCEGATGTTVAVQVAPYRALLIEAARTYGQAIFSEQVGDSAGRGRCDVP